VFRVRPPHTHAVCLNELAAGCVSLFFMRPAVGPWPHASLAARLTLCFAYLRAPFLEQEVFQENVVCASLAAINRWVCRALGKLAATSLFFRRLSHVRRAIDGGPYDV
jgi:hypothetical protein